MNNKLPNVLLTTSKAKGTDTVYITLSNGGSGTRRITVNTALTLDELKVSLHSSKPAPEFPQAKLNALTGTGPEKVAATKAIMAEYEKAANAYAADGGDLLEDRIIARVMDYLVSKEGFSLKDSGSNTKVIKASDLQVSTLILSDGGHLFTVTGSAVWGSILSF